MLILTFGGCLENPLNASEDAAQTTEDAAQATGADAAATGGGRDAGSTPPSSCFSPTQNLDIAYTVGAHGCACNSADEDQCIDGVALICDGTWRAVEDGPCFPAWHGYTVAECQQRGGIALSDPGDGSIVQGGCPRGMRSLGFIDAGWDEGGRCCEPTAESCAPQRAHMLGTCEPAPRFFWIGGGCVGLTGCSCSGEDCDDGFATEESCTAAYMAATRFRRPVVAGKQAAQQTSTAPITSRCGAALRMPPACASRGRPTATPSSSRSAVATVRRTTTSAKRPAPAAASRPSKRADDAGDGLDGRASRVPR